MSDLGELEDLYYATCAKLKERLDDINIRLSNGFIKPADNYFTYNSEGLGITDPVKAADWKITLLAHGTFLYDPLVEGIMDRAVFLKHKRAKEAESPGRLPLNGKFSGLRDVRNMSCGMIFGSLSEKYRIIVHQEELEKAQKVKLEKTHALAVGHYKASSKEDKDRASRATIPLVHYDNTKWNMAREGEPTDSINAKLPHGKVQHEIIKDNEGTATEGPKAHLYYETADQAQRYVSPYNLDERAKKLDQPGGPEMPCICDPECICLPLCAAEPTQNCFCEENALFCRVTEGMDIDDLSYPTKATEEAEAEKAGKEYLAQLMALDESQHEVLETSSFGETYSTFNDSSTTTETYSNKAFTFNDEPYSTLEPIHTLENPVDNMEVKYPTSPAHELLPDGQLANAEHVGKRYIGRSLSIWATESASADGQYRYSGRNWHDEMRAEMDAQRRAAGPDPDFHYPHFTPYGRLNLQRIHDQRPTRGQRLLRITTGNLSGKRPPLMLSGAATFSQGNTSSSGSVAKHGKTKSKTSLFANRLIGRSVQPTSRASPDPNTRFGERPSKFVGTSKVLPSLPK